MKLLAKDTQLALSMAAKAGADCLSGPSAAQAFTDAARQGYADLDDGALLAFFRQRFSAAKAANSHSRIASNKV